MSEVPGVGSRLASTGTWTVDVSNSRIGFAVKHLGVATVHGRFSDFDGTLVFGESPAPSRAFGTVRVASVDTGDRVRDQNLCSAGFFAAGKFPEISFESTAIRASGDNEFEIAGNLTICGVSNEIPLVAEVTGTDIDDSGATRVGLEVTGELSRAAYGMKFNAALGSGNMVVADKVKLAIEIEAIRQDR